MSKTSRDSDPFKKRNEHITRMTSEEVDEFLLKSRGISRHLSTFRRYRMLQIEPDAVPVENCGAIVEELDTGKKRVIIIFTDGTMRVYNYDNHCLITAFIPSNSQLKRIGKKKLDPALRLKIEEKRLF